MVFVSLFALVMIPNTIIESHISIEIIIYIVCLSILFFTLSLIIRIIYFNYKNPTLELRFHLWDPLWFIPSIIISIILGVITIFYYFGNNYLLNLINDFYGQTVGNTRIDKEWQGFVTIFIFLPLVLLPYYLLELLIKKPVMPIKIISMFLVILYTGLLLYVLLIQSVSFNIFLIKLQLYDSLITKFLAGSVYIGWLFLIFKELPCRNVYK